MSRTDPKTLLDGYALVNEGVDSHEPPQMLPRTKFSWASNITLRDRLPQTRPGWNECDLFFPGSDGVNDDATLRAAFEDGLFQGAIGFERRRQLVVSVAGRLYAITPDSWQVVDVTPSNSTANPNLSRAWFAEAEDFIIRQDGQTSPWIYDGASTRPADSAGRYGPKEVPGGTVMCYSQGRLIVAIGDGRTFVVGDIVGSQASGTAQYGYRDSVLRFTENDIIAQGGSFAIPINAGTITAMRPVAQVDTSLGQGPTQIFSTCGIFSLNTPSDRTTWKTVNYPIQTFSVVQAGSASDRATINVNGDIWMRAIDGVRSFQVARRDFGSWTNTPQSLEVIRALRFDDQELLDYSSSALFDNRLLMTTRPYQVFDHGVCHRGLVALDFAPVASLGSQARPVWEGVWCGVQILQILSVTWGQTQRCFIFALDEDNKIRLWELTRDALEDKALDTDPTQIEWMFETGGYSFPDLGYDEKKFARGWVWAEEILGECTMSFQYRANGAPEWRNWHSLTFCATKETCDSEDCESPVNAKSQTRRPWLLPDVNPVCDAGTLAPSNIGEWFQVRVSGTGSLRVPRLLVQCAEVQQAVRRECQTAETCRTVNVCPDDGFNYAID